MKRLNGLHIAVLIVLVANAVALRHASANRSGSPDAEIELTDRELVYYSNGSHEPVFLRLEYSGSYYSPGDYSRYITEADLRAVGFDLSRPANAHNAYNHYRRQQARSVIAAFEYEGASWKQQEEAIRNSDPKFGQKRLLTHGSRLVPIGIGPDLATMRQRFPDRSKIILLPASVRVRAGSTKVEGWISDVPAVIHVPHEFQQQFRDLPTKVRADNQTEPLYKVRLRFGANLEPWILSVEFPAAQ
ncbi:MAG: DUF4824 family protein [Acidobacteria bacterium]|nr:DUF4824 family protein [Acidobacteriota bacterium]